MTFQCDASQSGLGAALLQGGQPVAYASRALTPTESRYAQIEKELLSIVFACKHFEPYVYGRDCVNVETDHQPLVSIVTKPLDKAPCHLQRMLLQLQRHSLHVMYKKGSRNQLPTENIAEYLAALRKLATDCNFGSKEALEETLRDRLVGGVRSVTTQKKLLSMKDLTFSEACGTARSLEAAEVNAKEINHATSGDSVAEKGVTVHFVAEHSRGPS